MSAFILQTIALSLGIFLIGLFLGRFLKKLFCKNNHKIEAQSVSSRDSSDSSNAGKLDITASAESSNGSIAAKAAGVSAAVAGAAVIAKTMSGDDNSESDNKVETSLDTDIDDIKTDSLEDATDINVDLESDVELDAPDVEGTLDTLKEKGEVVSDLGEQGIDEVKELLLEGETLLDNLEEKRGDIQAAVGGEVENLMDTAKGSISNTAEVVKDVTDVTSSVDGGLNIDTAKAAITTAAGAVAATAGASLLNKENEDATDSSSKEPKGDSTSNKTSPQATTLSVDYPVTETIHRTIRRRHRSSRRR